MGLLKEKELVFARAISKVTYCNPFRPERIEYERDALGVDFVGTDTVWSIRLDVDEDRPNLSLLRERVEALTGNLRERLAKGERGSEEELLLYEDLVLYLVYHRFQQRYHDLILQAHQGRPAAKEKPFWEAFFQEATHFLKVPGLRLPSGHEPSHAFACGFQVRRAFHHIYSHIVGSSMPAARLRAAVWESIFSHDLRRYYRSLYDRMSDFTTLITGESGTGKDLVARAIGLSRYIPFDPGKQTFSESFVDSFHALSVSALSPTLVESELFGHRRGAFTGAVEDRPGWLEVCGQLGSVFLDEIGELEPALQVKLLRVLQTRTFKRLGDTKPRHFPGKIIAATNRDLGLEMRERRFREDLYYRLCSDIIVTPSLREQFDDCPDDLRNLVLFIARRVAAAEADTLVDEAVGWIEANLGRAYRWPGNFRELEQCVRNLLIRKNYQPPQLGADRPSDELARILLDSGMCAEDLMRYYCTAVYAQTGSYQATARRLNLDHRTVKSRIDPELLDQLSHGG